MTRKVKSRRYDAGAESLVRDGRRDVDAIQNAYDNYWCSLDDKFGVKCVRV